MSRPVRLLGLTLVVALLAGLLPSPAGARLAVVADQAPTPGAPGVGDPYWPLDGNGGIDVRHYDVEVAYDFGTAVLTGTTTLTMRAKADLSRFNLDLLLPVSAVTVDGVAATFTKPSRHELQVTPAAPLARGSVVDVVVSYAGDPEGIVYAGETNWIANDREVVTSNQPHMAPWWYAANDHPRDKATFDVTVTGPATHQAVSNGTLVGRAVDGTEATTHWRSQHPMTTYNAFFALGRYRVEQTVRDGLPSYIAVSKDLDPGRFSRGLRDLRRSDEITAFLARTLGPYPFESTGGLRTGLVIGFALETQTRPIYDTGMSTPLLVHELTHQWFGNSVSVHGWRDIWVSEGFADFMEHYYAERHGGPGAQKYLRKARVRDYPDGFWQVDLTDPGAGNIFDDAVYLRGGMALQALRHRIGSKVFFRLLRTWVRDHQYGTGTVSGFRELAEEVSGQRLDGFFRAWLKDPRPPAFTKANGLR